MLVGFCFLWQNMYTKQPKRGEIYFDLWVKFIIAGRAWLSKVSHCIDTREEAGRGMVGEGEGRGR